MINKHLSSLIYSDSLQGIARFLTLYHFNKVSNETLSLGIEAFKEIGYLAKNGLITLKEKNREEALRWVDDYVQQKLHRQFSGQFSFKQDSIERIALDNQVLLINTLFLLMTRLLTLVKKLLEKGEDKLAKNLFKSLLELQALFPTLYQCPLHASEFNLYLLRFFGFTASSKEDTSVLWQILTRLQKALDQWNKSEISPKDVENPLFSKIEALLQSVRIIQKSLIPLVSSPKTLEIKAFEKWVKQEKRTWQQRQKRLNFG